MKELQTLESRYPYAKVDKFVIMPTHMHLILRLYDGTMPRAGLTDIIGAYKSLATRAINAARNTQGKKQFQRSFYETVIRNESAYQSCWSYIDANPDRWGVQEKLEWRYLSADEAGTEKLRQRDR